MARKSPKRRAPRARPTSTSIPRTTIWIGELAARWGISKPTLWRYRRDRKLPACDFKIGDREGWKRATIEAFEQSGARP